MIVATIEARMASSRLPGKVLMDIAGRPALARLVDRLRRARSIDAIVLATTANAADDALERWADGAAVRCFRGSEDDVLGRVLGAARDAGADTIVEITGDCPLLDPEVIDRAVEVFLEGGWDVVSNTWRPSYPQGVDAQVFPCRLLEEVAQITLDPADREHVSLYFYEHPERYRIHHLQAAPQLRAPHLRFQLDYPDDLTFIRAVYEALAPTRPDFSLTDVLELLTRQPELTAINRHCREKALR